jgi:holo-[acyl-carrier protein] synthase
MPDANSAIKATDRAYQRGALPFSSDRLHPPVVEGMGLQSGRAERPETRRAHEEAGINDVVAVGIDLVNMSDVRRAVDDLGEAYLQRVYTSQELADCHRRADPLRHLAARFAAKEAVIKTLRVAGAQPPWTSIEVWHDTQGRCELRLNGAAAGLANQRSIGKLALSLAYDGDLAVAVVVATGV